MAGKDYGAGKGTPRYIPTRDLARELNLSLRSVQRYQAAGKITPAFTTPGGVHMWVLDDVLTQLRELRRPD